MAKMVEEELYSVLRRTLQNGPIPIPSVVYNVCKQAMSDVIGKGVISGTMEAHIAN